MKRLTVNIFCNEILYKVSAWVECSYGEQLISDFKINNNNMYAIRFNVELIIRKDICIKVGETQ